MMKKQTKSNNKIQKEVFLAVIILLILLSFYLIYLISSCSKYGEIKAYLKLEQNGFYLGPRYCPVTWDLPRKSIDDIKSLSKEESIQILTPNENNDLENIMKDRFTNYNKYTAKAENSTFYIYETNCKICGKK